MKLSETQTLRQFLQSHLIVLGIMVTLIYGYAMSVLYSLGLDDASEFYLYQDAEAAEVLILNGQALPTNTPHRQVFLGTDNLPSHYQDIIDVADTASQ